MVKFLYSTLLFVFIKWGSNLVSKRITLVATMKLFFSNYIDDCLYYDNDFVSAFQSLTLAMYSRSCGHEFTWPFFAVVDEDIVLRINHISGMVNVVADQFSWFVVPICPLHPKLLMEHRWSKEYDCTDESICTVYFHTSIICKRTCSIVTLVRNCFGTIYIYPTGILASSYLAVDPRCYLGLNPYDAVFLYTCSYFPSIHVYFADGGNSVGLWSKLFYKVIIAASSSSGCTYSIQG